MSKDAEVDMKDVELNELDQEKQPMTGTELAMTDTHGVISNEKNGCVKVKVPEDAEAKFTGLSKEELMKVAGTPGWVRTRWALLILFWLGWVGMLAGAIAIIVQAPRCKPLPEMNWWNYGPLYRIPEVEAFTPNGLEELKDKVGDLNQLKVKGVVAGPLHTAQEDQPNTLSFDIDSAVGTEEQFKSFLDTAHKKGISVVLDVTPNYKGKNPWFSSQDVTEVTTKLKQALVRWMDVGVDGFQLAGIESLVNTYPDVWSELKNIVHEKTEEGAKKKALIGVTEYASSQQVSDLLNASSVDLLLSKALSPNGTGQQWADAIHNLYSNHNQTNLAWSLGTTAREHVADLGQNRVRLHLMLLFTLPGTPVLNYGDEIGLHSQDPTKLPAMMWDPSEPEDGLNETAKTEREQRQSYRLFYKTLSELRGKERSLLHGDLDLLHNGTSSLAYLRSWDQSERYLAAFNWGASAVPLRLHHQNLPEHVAVTLSTKAEQEAGSTLELQHLQLEPGQALLLQFPFSG